MQPSRERYYRWLFLTAAVYDIVLGFVFLFLGQWAFDLLDIGDELPSGGYVPLLGAFLLVIGIGYYLIYRGDLWENRDLIVVGTLYKLAYSGVGLWVAVFSEPPHVLFVALFGVADVVFLVLMVECLMHLYKNRAPAAHLTG